MRQIVLDTETTGLSTASGHRIIEIGAVELVDRWPTGNNYHIYLNPEREIDAEAFEVHGISNDFLLDKPHFAEIMPNLIDYLTDAELIIHNAPFDVGFLNYEFRLVDKKAKRIDQLATVFDTLDFARKKHPGKKNNLDALCRRYNVDNAKRDLHGALLDAQLLAEVYLAMTGGQMHLFAGDSSVAKQQQLQQKIDTTSNREHLIIIPANSEEEAAHQTYLDYLQQQSGRCLWQEE